MLRYDQLTADQQQRAEEAATVDILTAICDGALRFDDGKNGDDLQARIDAALEESERLRTPWFAAEIVMERAGEEIRGIARADAQDALYLEDGEVARRV